MGALRPGDERTDGRTDRIPSSPRAMAERKASGKAAEDEEVPAFFKNLGSGSPKPRQKFCGMFCPVEGSSENKTIDFDSLSVGRGSGQVVAQQRDVAHLGPDPQPPYSRQGRREPSVESGRKVEIRRASGKEALQNIYDQVGLREHRPGGSLFPPLGKRPRVPARVSAVPPRLEYCSRICTHAPRPACLCSALAGSSLCGHPPPWTCAVGSGGGEEGIQLPQGVAEGWGGDADPPSNPGGLLRAAVRCLGAPPF